jgi:hypothetical protein
VPAQKGAWFAAIPPLSLIIVATIRAPSGFTLQETGQLEECAMLAKLIVGLARTNIIAQCAQMTNMRLTATVIISVLSVPLLMVRKAREKSARLAKSIAKDAKAALLATYVQIPNT